MSDHSRTVAGSSHKKQVSESGPNSDIRSGLYKLLERLVEFQTVTGDYQQSAECLSYIEQWCSDRGLFTHELVQNNFPSLVAGTNPGKKFDLMFSAHIDVLPGHEAQFSLIEDNNKLYGRGVYDMKFAAACFMQLINEFQNQLADYNVGFMFTSDEEVGGANGTKALVDQGFLADLCIVPDGGDNWCVEEAAKGAWLVKLECRGKSSHGSRPWAGDNAAEKLIKLLPKLLSLNSNQPEGATIALTKIKGGEAVNAVAEKAEATLDVRFLDILDYEYIHNHFKRLAKQHGCSLSPLIFVEPIQHDLKSWGHKNFNKIVSEVVGTKNKDLSSCLSLGGSDGRFFAKAGADVIVCRPVGGGTHAEDEWIDEQSFYQYYEVLKRFIISIQKNNKTL